MMTDAVTISLIGAIVSLCSSLLVIFNTWLTAKIKAQGEDNAKQLAETHHVIHELEKNTNSIKDALVKVTGEAEFAKGLKVGTEAAGVIIVNKP